MTQAEVYPWSFDADSAQFLRSLRSIVAEARGALAACRQGFASISRRGFDLPQ